MRMISQIELCHMLTLLRESYKKLQEAGCKHPINAIVICPKSYSVSCSKCHHKTFYNSDARRPEEELGNETECYCDWDD